MIRKFKNSKRILSNQRGIAMMVALAAMTLLLFLAVEVSYDTNVEYVTASNNLNRLKTYYAAKAGMELSLLRILVYQKAISQFGDTLGENKGMLNSIWSFPLSWPVSQYLPDNISRVDKELIKGVEKESLFKGPFVAVIESEESKIDINDLGSPSEVLRDAVKTQLLSIFNQEMEVNDEFSEKYRGFDFEGLVNNLIDWVDEDSDSLSAGDERSPYQDKFKGEFIPPNQPFKTIEEIHMVDKMNDDFFDLLKSRITIYGIKGVNVNQANNDVIKSIIVDLTDEQMAQIRERITNPDKGGPFKNLEEFEQFVSSLGVLSSNFNPAKLPLLFDATYNFRIKVLSEIAGSVRELVAVTFDYETAKERLITQLDEDDKKKNNDEDPEKPEDQVKDSEKEDDGTEKKTKDEKKQIPQGRPNVVYWMEN